jgi:hypothetical protein
MYAAIPSVHRTYHADATRAGGPHRKMSAGDSRDGMQVRAQFFVSVVMAALADQMQVEISK